ncbi:hypothetical protein Ndes2437A_g00892 [Nannochloris sp. 'desiccata']
MSRSRSGSRRSASARRNAGEEIAIVDNLAFQPIAVCGGRLSTSEYNLRSRKCTEDQLERLKATPEFKAWEQERGVEAGPSWQARLNQVKEQASALLPPSLVLHSKTIAIVSVITLLLVLPMLFTLPTHTQTKSSAFTDTPATTTAAKGKTPSSPLRVPEAASIPTSQKNTEAKLEDPSKEAVKKEDYQEKLQTRKENEIAAALQLEISKAKRAAAAAQEQQRQLVIKLEEALKREAVLTEETKRLAAAAAAVNAKASAGLHYALYYLATLGPDVGLLAIEAGLLLLAAVLLLGLRKSRQAAEKMKTEYLGAYRRQMKMFAKAEEAYETAYAAQFAAENMAIELREAGNASAHSEGSAAAAAAAAAEATAEREHELQAKEQQLEKKVEEVKASAAAQSSAWAAAAAQLLQLAAASPHKNKNKNQPQQKSRLSISSSPPSPNTLVTTVTDKYTQLRTRLTTAEAAAKEASNVAETARQERERSEQRVSEMMTDNELLKERLADTKKALAVATDAKAAAELHEAEVRAALETAQQNLATVNAEKEYVMTEAESLKESLKTASEKADAAIKGGNILEAQIDQLTNSLGDESAQKQRAEQRCAQLANDLSALEILADGLQNQVSALEQRLEESMAAQIELKFASKQLEAAHAAAMAAASAPTGQSSPALVQRALNEESAALERLTTAERRATEASTLTSYALTGGEDVAPRPSLPLTTGGSSSSYPPLSPQQINSQRASSLIARAGKIASMLSEGMDGLLGASSPPVNSGGLLALTAGGAYSARSSVNLSARNEEGENGLRQHHRHSLHSSAHRRSSIGSNENGSLTARMARASQLFTAAEQYLGQELPSSSSEAAGKRPYRDIPLLLQGDATVNVKTVNGAKESSSADEEIARFIAAGNLMLKESENLQSSLRALGTNPGSSAAAERLSASRVKISAAVGSAETATKRVEENRVQHAALAADARERQRALEDAQLALTAAMEENSDEVAVAAAAQHLRTAETAQQAASEAVYQAERDMYAAVSAQLAARDALKSEQEVLQEAFTAATNLLSGGSGGDNKDLALADALTVSPRLPLGLNTVPTDVFA